MPAIFISYRRDDSLSATGRLASDLAQQFGTGQVFRDADAIEAGEDFRAALSGALNDADLVLVVIGRNWLNVRGQDGAPRLTQTNDYVRWEIEAALARDTPIIPVLVEGAAMPTAAELPDSIRPLAYRQAQELSSSRWSYDQACLRERLENLGISTLAPEKAASGIDVLRRTILDMVTLVHRPKSVLTARSLDPKPLLSALAFLLITQLAAAWILPYESPAPYWQFLATLPLLTLLVILFLSGPLYLAWRLVGAPKLYVRMLTILTYQLSFMGLGSCVAAMILITGVEVSKPQFFARMMTLLHQGGEGAIRQLWSNLGSTADGKVGIAWMAGGIVSSLLVLLLMVWFLASWGAYRAILQKSRLQSAIALWLFAVGSLSPILLIGWLASIAA